MTPTSGPARTRAPQALRRARLLGLVAVLGPGLLAGLSDDDPAGITTYSVLGAQFGYQMLWVLLLSTVALVVFHSLAAQMGVVTGQGLIGLIRQRYGVRSAGLAITVLVLANVGTTCAEFAGIAAGFEMFGRQSLRVRPSRCGRRLRAGAAGELPPRGAHLDGVGHSPPRVHCRGPAGPP